VISSTSAIYSQVTGVGNYFEQVGNIRGPTIIRTGCKCKICQRVVAALAVIRNIDCCCCAWLPGTSFLKYWHFIQSYTCQLTHSIAVSKAHSAFYHNSKRRWTLPASAVVVKPLKRTTAPSPPKRRCHIVELQHLKLVERMVSHRRCPGLADAIVEM
jgi:hypothetical protein